MNEIPARARNSAERALECSYCAEQCLRHIGDFGYFGQRDYGFARLGKFIGIFIPWKLVKGCVHFAAVPHVYGILFTLLTMFYSIIGSMQQDFKR